MKKYLYLCVLALGIAYSAAAQEASWSVEFQGGLPYNIPTQLVIEQENEPTLRLNAEFSSEPFVSPVYYVLRIARWKNKSSWEFEFVHHKLFLDNKPPEIEGFSISHGYNMAMVNHSFKKLFLKKHEYILRLGAGVILSHPENTVRGQTLQEDIGLSGLGYYITGPVLNITLAKQFYIAKWFFVNTEVKFNPSVSSVPIQGGHATVWNLPLAFAFGLGINIDTGGN